MTIDHSPAFKNVKPHRLKLVFISLVALCAGFLYLTSQDINWKQTFESIIEQPANSPAKQVSLPASPSAVLPSFDVVSADEAGIVVAAGKGPPGAVILLQNGSQTLGETKADDNGEWVLMLDKPLPAGDYVLSLQAIDTSKQLNVTGRRTVALTIAPHGNAIQTHLQAALPKNADRPSAQGNPLKENAMAVKRGDTLWDIARRHYGDATRYPEIVDANKPQIKNPNLIFPNQQFEIPHK